MDHDSDLINFTTLDRSALIIRFNYLPVDFLFLVGCPGLSDDFVLDVALGGLSPLLDLDLWSWTPGPELRMAGFMVSLVTLSASAAMSLSSWLSLDWVSSGLFITEKIMFYSYDKMWHKLDLEHNAVGNWLKYKYF